ncbi:acetate kinase [Caedimonas varicaedens]|uniref:Acetate kinase n=1 Tax=Caedimonas varicaedens TaxID=1629334 RepID=A0A0K8MEY3_9PROT|nr:acetate kinase [Caedimonas varicaedens]
MLGASLGISESMQKLEQSPDVNAKKALEYFEYSVLKYIGAYTAALGGLDTLVFTAGIGEHDASFRARISAKLLWLGVELDHTANDNAVGGNQMHKISSQNSKVVVYMIPTDEELMIAKNVVELFNLN